MRGIVLDPFNFTPLKRTPWAGDLIWKQWKSHLPGCPKDQKIGESWEFSLDESFPSRIRGSHEKLSDYLKAHGASFLGETQFARSKDYIETLIKVIHADRPLSLQVHPDDHYSELGASECGKPESWLILDAKPNAGVYLGFSKPLSKAQLAEKLSSGEDIRDYLQFVPVRKGDYFELGPGVPHALGEGVVVFEPQIVRQGKSGKTYRLWDWGMLYDEAGEPSPQGKPRELHIKQGLDLINPSEQVGLQFLNSVKRQFKEYKLANGAHLYEYPANDSYQVFWLSAQGGKTQTLSVKDGYCIAFVADGSLQVDYPIGLPDDALRGQTILFGENCLPANLHLNGDLCLVVNAGASLQCI